jgi:hydroxylysine kinase
MATMIAPPQPVPVERAVALVRERYGLAVSAARLTGERDENFRLTGESGAEYVLKIANPAENEAETDFQTAALRHLETADPSLPCPRVILDRAGAPHIRFEARGNERSVRLVTYLPGRLLGTSQRSARQRAACGRIGARLTLALRPFEHPASQRAVVWDLRHTGHMRQLLAELPGFPFQAAATGLLERLVPSIDARLPRVRHQVVHNDLNPLNILVDPADEARVAGVIDFGDMTRTALIADVAVCAAEMIPVECADAARARDCVRDVAIAYHERLPLLPEELEMLGTLVAARLLMNLVVHEWHVHKNPASGHFTALDAPFMEARLEIASGLSLTEMTL